MEPWWQTAMMIVLLLALPPACALLLKHAGAAGWAVLGGVVAGILLGPTILGRTLPLVHETLFVGGVEQREQLDRLMSEQGAERLVAETAGFDPEAIEAMREHQAEAVHTLEETLQAARWEHQKPLRLLAALLAGMTLLSAGFRAVPRPRPEQIQHPVSWLSIGLWSAALPGALAFIAATRWWGWDVAQSVIVAAAVATGPWVLTKIDREAADQAEQGGAHMIQTAGRFATLLALAFASYGFIGWLGWDALPWLAALWVVVVGWMLPIKPMLADFAQSAVVPSLAAVATIHMELFAHFAIWPIVVLLVLSADGRWVGAVLGAVLLGGRSGLRTMRLVLGVMACGPTQLAIVAVAVHLWLVSNEAVMALVCGAVLIEVTAPLRRGMAKRLTDAEEWEME